jgi:hypothetical protein
VLIRSLRWIISAQRLFFCLSSFLISFRHKCRLWPLFWAIKVPLNYSRHMLMSQTAPTLRLSPLFNKTSQTLASHSEGSGDSGLHPQDAEASSSNPYVLNIANLPCHYAISTSAPSNAIRVVDKRTLVPVSSLGSSKPLSSGTGSKPSKGGSERQAHVGGVTSLKSYTRFLGEKKGGLMSGGKDGRVVLWDERSPGGDGSLTSEYFFSSHSSYCS